MPFKCFQNFITDVLQLLLHLLIKTHWFSDPLPLTQSPSINLDSCSCVISESSMRNSSRFCKGSRSRSIKIKKGSNNLGQQTHICGLFRTFITPFKLPANNICNIFNIWHLLIQSGCCSTLIRSSRVFPHTSRPPKYTQAFLTFLLSLWKTRHHQQPFFLHRQPPYSYSVAADQTDSVSINTTQPLFHWVSYPTK